ncbi:MAG: TIGR00266 family protein [Lachnospiraceae bacterium]|nr:TIGR00266 family protein [Lachnospiraceae bacterium]MDE6699201.1 TIGR00266 family protein [Lachnospiraceae bacterium]
MKYEIKGTPLPVVICYLDQNEQMITEKGAMSWMSPNMQMETKSGGIGKAFSKAFSGEAMFSNVYTAMGGPGMIAFASSFPGNILPFQIAPGCDMIVQKSGFLASETGVNLSIYFQRKVGAGFFGGEGFIMQKLSGQGIAFVEVDGSVVDYTLAAGQQMVIDTGYLVAMDASVAMDIRQVPGLKNKLLGGEGLFNTVVTGPGRIWLQTMPINVVSAAVNGFSTAR